MATASKHARQLDQSTADGVPSEFLVFQSNSGDYRWEVVASDGAALAQSGGFASFDDAERAAGRVRDGAASTRLEHRGGDHARPRRATAATGPKKG